MSARCWSLFVCVLLASGCGAKATQVIVILDAEPGVQLDSTQLHVVVQGGSGGTISTGGPLDELLTPGMGTPADPPYPFKLAIAPLGGDVSRSYSVTATALDGDTIVAQARIIGGYVEGEVVTVRLVLEDACVGVICGEGLTCKAHVCVDARTGEDADAGVRDAGLADGGLSDAGEADAAMSDAGVGDLGFDAAVNDLGLDAGADSGTAMDDAGPPDLGAPDLGPADLGLWDLGPPDLGPPDLGPPDLGAADLGTDLGARCTGSCDDFNPCTDDSCNLGTGLCVHTNNTAACDDGDPCTVGNVCSAGACSVGIAKNCDDTNVCTTDSCTAATGVCVHAPNTVSCNDGDVCTSGDVCLATACHGVAVCPMGVVCILGSCV